MEAADLFFNASRGHGSEFAGAGLNGTGAYPLTPLAARVKWAPSDNVEIRLAIAEGTPRNPDDLNDIGIKIDEGEGSLVLLQGDWFFNIGTRLSATYWTFTSKFDVLNEPSRQERGNSGAFAVIETPLDTLGDQGLYGFARFGIADARFNEVKSYVGAGLYYKGPFGRANDRAGLAIAKSAVSNHHKIYQGLDGGETNYEAAYHFHINEKVGLGATAQYITNPGAHPELRNSLVLGLRISVGQLFEWE